jgi:hypothetical protein
MTTRTKNLLSVAGAEPGAVVMLALALAIAGTACGDDTVAPSGGTGGIIGSGGSIVPGLDSGLGGAGVGGVVGTGGAVVGSGGIVGTGGATTVVAMDAGTDAPMVAVDTALDQPGTGGAAGTDGAGAGGAIDSATAVDVRPSCGSTGQTLTVPAVMTSDTTWTRCNTYVLPADTKVAVRAPAVLTIEAGTKITGLANSALVIARGAKIMANGTKDSPILFTSAKAVGSRAAGDWGGVIIMGKAPQNTNSNSTPASTEAIFEAYGSGEEDGKFGGTEPDDGSGSLKYVRIEFGGVAYLPNREWNNLTLCGVGRGTVVDYIQSHKGADDSIEFFGGTVGVKHLVLTQNEDDGFDTDNGWEGKAQFVVIQHMAPNGTDASNGYESDNHGTSASYTALPRTLPTVYNVTMIGKKDYALAGSWGAVFRRGTGGMYYNHIITRFASGVIEVRDQAAMDQITANNLFVKNSIFFDNVGADGNWPAPQATADIVEKTIFMNAAWNNRDTVDPMLADPTNLSAPNFKPMAGSPALTGGAAAPNDGFFDPSATFVGAIGADDWTAGWTAYPQN